MVGRGRRGKDSRISKEKQRGPMNNGDHGGVSGRGKELTGGGNRRRRGGGTGEAVEDSRKDPGRTFICS